MKSFGSEHSSDDLVAAGETKPHTTDSHRLDDGRASDAKSADESPPVLGANWAVRWAVQHGYRMLRRLVVALVGFSVLLIGLIMVVGPGPAILVIPLGLGILGLEFRWARRLLRYARQRLQSGIEDLSRRTRANPDPRSDDRSDPGERSMSA